MGDGSITKVNDIELRQLCKKSTVYELAAHFDASIACIKQSLKKLNLQAIPYRFPPARITEDDAEKIKSMARDMSEVKIALKMDISPTTIRKILASA